MEDVLPSIPGFYAGTNVFITGGLGFVGKVIVEKLLRSCPQIQNIYLLVRPKKGIMPEERINKLISLQLFDLLHETREECFSKLKVINGDLQELNLGMSEEDLTFIKDNVHVIFNCGANVNFDDTFQKAMFTNCRSVREMINMAKEMKHLKAFIQVSTTFANIHHKHIEEKVYPAQYDWRKCIELAENGDQNLIVALSHKIYEVWPNSYIFTKKMSECVIQDLGGDLPIDIVRLPIVMHSLKEPMPGWTDSYGTLYGPYILNGKGITHAGYTSDFKININPLDLAVKLMIVSAVSVASNQSRKLLSGPKVYNGSCSLDKAVTSNQILKNGREVVSELPFENVVWYPSGYGSSNITLMNFIGFFLNIVPAIFMDALLVMIGRKPRLIKIVILVHRTLMLICFFNSYEWHLHNENMLILLKQIRKEDRDDFDYSYDDIDLDDYIKIGFRGIKKYLLMEKDENIPKARAHMKRMYYLHIFLKYTLSSWFGYYMFKYLSTNVLSAYF